VAYEYRIDTHEGIVYSTLTGDLDVEEIIAGLIRVLEDDDFETGMSGITDLRGLKWESDQEDLRKLAGFMVEHRDRIGHSRTAVVVGGDRAYGMTRMFEVFSEQSSLDISVFRDIERAREWILRGPGAGKRKGSGRAAR
jgi:hypothetical protein